MIDVTAIVLSAEAYDRTWPGLHVLLRQQIIKTAAELQRARFHAIDHVATPWFFFLDDDDELPADIARVLDLAKGLDAALVYTDEIVVADGVENHTHRGPYSQVAHMANATLVHHLALCRTKDAQKAVTGLPAGHYAPEPMLYWELAKQGAKYLPEVGYRWILRPGSLRTNPQTSMSWTRSRLWCKANPT